MNAWGIGLVAGFVAIALIWLLNFVGWLQKVNWIKAVSTKVTPVLELVAMAGVGVVVIDWVLGWFGWSMKRTFDGLVSWVATWGSGDDLPADDLRKGILIFLGFALVACVLNVLGDCIVPKFKVNKKTHASAFAAAIIPSFFVAQGFIGSFMSSTGGGLTGALTTFGSSISGG